MKILDINGNERECLHIAPDKAFPGFMKIAYESKTRKGYTHSEWLKNVFANCPLWISRGKGEGQTRIILANDSRRLTIDKPWQEIPNGTSQYVISYHIHAPQTLGNVLPGGSK